MTPQTAACQAPLSSTISQSLLRFVCTESMMLSKHRILCHRRLFLQSIFPSIRVFSNESVLPTLGAHLPVRGVLVARMPKWLAVPPPVDHVLSELFTVTHSSQVAPHSKTHSFIELCKTLCHDKAVICEGEKVRTNHFYMNNF